MIRPNQQQKYLLTRGQSRGQHILPPKRYSVLFAFFLTQIDTPLLTRPWKLTLGWHCRWSGCEPHINRLHNQNLNPYHNKMKTKKVGRPSRLSWSSTKDSTQRRARQDIIPFHLTTGSTIKHSLTSSRHYWKKRTPDKYIGLRCVFDWRTRRNYGRKWEGRTAVDRQCTQCRHLNYWEGHLKPIITAGQDNYQSLLPGQGSWYTKLHAYLWEDHVPSQGRLTSHAPFTPFEHVIHETRTWTIIYAAPEQPLTARISSL